MNSLDEMMPACRSCPYWEIAEEPYICDKCLDKAKAIFSNKDKCLSKGKQATLHTRGVKEAL